MKNKETLEEVAIRLVKKTTLYGSQEATIGSSARSYFETELRCVLIGMNWQQENSYSEEDMRKAYSIGWITRERFDDLSPDIIYPKGLDYEEKQDYAFNLWFEQIKNK